MDDKEAKKHLQYLVELSLLGGPKCEEFELLSEWFKTTIRLKKHGQITVNQIRELWDQCGDAFSTKTIQGLLVRKPHGYAGDFEIIDRIHTKWVSPFSHLKQWDLYLHSTAAPKAVRNRKIIFHNMLVELKKSTNYTARVLNVGSGPARDLNEHLNMSRANEIFFDCVDMDKNAIEYAKNINCNFNNQINWHCCNIFRFHTSESYDLIWSAGLFDYLSDKHFVFLLKRFYEMANRNGKIVIGNFSNNNPTQANMEFGEWIVEYRSEEKLREMAKSASIPDKFVSIFSEEEGLNLFLNIQKDL